jgi:hypothetical protein
MSGGSGGIIIIKSTVTTLSDPIVHGSLPQSMQDWIDPILAKHPAGWTDHDKVVVGHVFSWALCNLQ